jgi:hypothetical protein
LRISKTPISPQPNGAWCEQPMEIGVRRLASDATTWKMTFA